MMQGLQRATEAARASRGRPPRPVHLLDWLVPGNTTWCGRGGVCFSAPTTTSPAEATCKTCLRAYAASEEREP